MEPGRLLRSGYVRLKRRLDDLSPAEARRAARDAHRLTERYPWLASYAERAQVVSRRFRGDHTYYVTEVGHPVHAASVELVVFLTVLCEELRPARVVDLGSGFSSYVLRRWAAEAGQRRPETWSVDDSAEWLGRTEQFLESRGMPTEHLLTWTDFRRADAGAFDLVLHDMGTMEFRAETLREVIGLARPGGDPGVVVVLVGVVGRHRHLQRADRRHQFVAVTGLEDGELEGEVVADEVRARPAGVEDRPRLLPGHTVLDVGVGEVDVVGVVGTLRPDREATQDGATHVEHERVGWGLGPLLRIIATEPVEAVVTGVVLGLAVEADERGAGHLLDDPRQQLVEVTGVDEDRWDHSR